MEKDWLNESDFISNLGWISEFKFAKIAGSNLENHGNIGKNSSAEGLDTFWSIVWAEAESWDAASSQQALRIHVEV